MRSANHPTPATIAVYHFILPSAFEQLIFFLNSHSMYAVYSPIRAYLFSSLALLQ